MRTNDGRRRPAPTTLVYLAIGVDIIAIVIVVFIVVFAIGIDVTSVVAIGER